MTADKWVRGDDGAKRLVQCPGCWSAAMARKDVDWECECGELMTVVDLRGERQERDRLREAAAEVVHQYDLWSEDANDGTYALWQRDGLINAIIALRAVTGGHQ